MSVYERLRLAIRKDCYGKGLIQDGLTFEAERGGAEPMVARDVETERAVDSWQLEVLEKSIWHMWHVAVFRFERGPLSFDHFEYSYDPNSMAEVTPERTDFTATVCMPVEAPAPYASRARRH